jgi:hypothetical protein
MKTRVLHYFVLGIPALVLAVPQLVPFVGRVSKEKFVTFVPIWADDHLNFFTLWWPGLGVFWAMSLFHCFTVMSYTQIKLYIPSLFVFTVSNFIHYQPWNLDNTKVFYNGWVPLAVAAVANFLAVLVGGKNAIAALNVVTQTSSCGASSAIGLWKAMVVVAGVWDDPDPYAIATWAIEHSEPKSVWVTDSHHNHPIPTLAGRQILFGYRGWLPSHHLDEGSRVQAVEELQANSDSTDLIDQFGVDFICFCRYYPRELPFRFGPTAKKWKLEHHTPLWEVWRRLK